jgi:hypothetical protein
MARRVHVALACLLLALVACSTSLPVGDSGSIPMAPFSDPEAGIRGLTVVPGWSDRAALVQQSFPGTAEELTALLTEQTDLVQLPRSAGTYEGAHLQWDLYVFETQVEDAGPGIYRVDLALAKGEAAYYIVILVTQPADYAANRARYDALFQHALYALAPLEPAA